MADLEVGDDRLRLALVEDLDGVLNVIEVPVA